MVLLLGSSVLTGCATAGTGSPGAGTDLAATATTAPVTPPGADFVDRASTVAEAVRRAGVPTGPSRPVLLSGWTLDGGFDTVEQKVSWNARKVVLAPGVDSRTSGPGTMTDASGSRRVAVVSASDALDRALRGDSDAPGSCDGIAAADCRLVVARVQLVEGSVRTNRGPATVPVWRLTIVGLSHTISVVAVADGVFEWTPPGPSAPLPGLPAAPDGFRAADSLKRVDGSEVEVGIGGGACEVELRAHVVELDDMVVVGATTDPPPPDLACPAIYVSTPALLHLSKPLGSRPVIDVVTGRPRLLGVPPV